MDIVSEPYFHLLFEVCEGVWWLIQQSVMNVSLEDKRNQAMPRKDPRLADLHMIYNTFAYFTCRLHPCQRLHALMPDGLCALAFPFLSARCMFSILGLKSQK